jgi:CBS domain-containing protein
MVKVINIARKNIIFCKIDDTVNIIAKIMTDYKIGSVLVKDIETDKFVGLIDDRRLFRLLTKKENPIPKKAKEIMVPLKTIKADFDIVEAWEDMEKKDGERFCIVDDKNNVIGIVKKRTIGILRLKYLKQKLGIVDI